MINMNHSMVFALIGIALAFATGKDAVDTVNTTSKQKVILYSDNTWSMIDTSTTESAGKSSSTNIDTSCHSLVETYIDKMTGDSSLNSKSPIRISKDNKTGFSITLMSPEQGSLILAITVFGASPCIDEESKINILFTDNTKIELSSNNKYNCDGIAKVYFGSVFGNEEALELLLSKRVSAMRVWTMKSFVQEDFPDIKAAIFSHTLNCLWKTNRVNKDEVTRRRRW